MKKYLILLLLATTLLNSASFDCKKASTKIEKAICADEKISNLDYELNETYIDLKIAIARNKVSKKNVNSLMNFFIKTQRKWVKNRNKWCNKYTKNDLGVCLKEHYTQRIIKLKEFSEDRGFIYRGYKNVLYMYNHRPYISTYFKELLDKNEYKKFLKDYNNWEKSYDVCVSKYGVKNEKCVLRVAKEKTTYYDKLLKSYENTKYLVENSSATPIVRLSKNYFVKYEDSEETRACYSYKYYPQSEYKKLFHLDINTTNLIEEVKLQKPQNPANPEACQSNDKCRFHFEVEQKIEYINKNVVVIMSDNFGYFGGTHGDYESIYYSIDRNTAEYIGWEDIFGIDKKLYNFIMKKMDYIVLYTDNYKESEYYDMAGSHMYLSDKGIVVKFGVYEISTYDQGEPSFLIPLKLLKQTLSKEKYDYYFNNDKSVELKSIYKKKS